MDGKAWFLSLVLLAGILWPLGRIWETWHREPSTCPPCLGSKIQPRFGKAASCGAPFQPMLNATCPVCRRLWYDPSVPEWSAIERALDVVPRCGIPTVFSEPRVLAMEGVYYNYAFWPWKR